MPQALSIGCEFLKTLKTIDKKPSHFPAPYRINQPMTRFVKQSMRCRQPDDFDNALLN